MGFMDDLKKMVVGEPGEAGGQSSMLDNLLEMLNDQKSGGITGLIQKFNEKGLGGHISSWIGTGENLPYRPIRSKTSSEATKSKNWRQSLTLVSMIYRSPWPTCCRS